MKTKLELVYELLTKKENHEEDYNIIFEQVSAQLELNPDDLPDIKAKLLSGLLFDSRFRYLGDNGKIVFGLRDYFPHGTETVREVEDFEEDDELNAEIIEEEEEETLLDAEEDAEE
ncbi:MAG: hypothetical protein LBR37_03400 [Erysipelotrichaceae bacterium]|jgi:hypothetical protein|nr:hypothetical protein [Erysipelotrichaceae bacterium]